ncbi:MAG: acetyl-CoA C-acetyltransferase [Alphaproteobacteria bacterium]|nr:acetyl-CoA C-acetyltransferase [Alphaproteobacteria bacterium]
MTDIVITAARRTPVGAFLGAFANTSAPALGSAAIKAALADSGIAPEDVSEVIMGNVLTAALGQGPARQASMGAGIPKEVPAVTINQLCGSGLRAVALGAQQITAGDARIIVAGGQENMSMAPHAQFMRGGTKMGPVTLADTMLKDGLTDAFQDGHMGLHIENVARDYQVSRADQDEFAVASQHKAGAAQAAGKFKDEIVPVIVKGRKGDTIVEQDEYPKPQTTLEGIAALKPAFAKDGTVTAANASGLNDGAAAVVLMHKDEAAKRGAKVMGRIASYAVTGVDPVMFGIGPISAVEQALKKAGWTVAELDLIEANEAFAAQTIAVGKTLGFDEAKVNVNGGAIAIGHPIGASGARVLTTLLHEMARRDAKKGLATLCVGGGMGIAMCIER